MSEIISLEEYRAGGDPQKAIDLSVRVLRAFESAASGGEVSYVYLHGVLLAAITPPAAGERFEHAALVEAQPRGYSDEGTGVLVRTSHRRARPRRWWLGPFEGVF